jgi:hypothetical protein
VFGIAIS